MGDARSPRPCTRLYPRGRRSSSSWTARDCPSYRGRQIFDAIHRRGLRDYARDERAARPAAGTARSRAADPSAGGGAPRRLGRRQRQVRPAAFGRRADRGRVHARRRARSPASTSSRTPAVPAPAGESGPRVPGSTPPADRFTVCLSSQTGCAVDCAFCVTGRLGGGRNLTAGEIVGAALRGARRDRARSSEGLRVVFMGMGEPFLNLDGVLGRRSRFSSSSLPPRRVTVSTSGITPAFARVRGAAAAAEPRRVAERRRRRDARRG